MTPRLNSRQSMRVSTRGDYASRALLSLALLHGINGMRIIVADYVRGPGWRLAVNSFFAILGFAMFVLGTVIVFTFDASAFGISLAAPSATNYLAILPAKKIGS